MWLCCIPANNTPEMIDPFLVPPAERNPRGSPSFPRPGFQGNRPGSITRMPVYHHTRRKPETWKKEKKEETILLV